MDLKRLEKEWIKQIGHTAVPDMKMWDSRAEEFDNKPIPDRRENPFLKYLWEKATPEANMSVLDIGCGAGQYSLALAPAVRSVTGTDISTKMIDAAERKAKAGGCTNAEFFALDWAAADIDERGWRENFDIVIAHMTPAVCDYASMEKMAACARGHCFLVRPARRSDEISDGALASVGCRWRTAERDMLIPNAFTYLWLKGYTPEVTERNALWTSERSAEDTVEWCTDRAQSLKDLSASDRETIRSYIMDRSHNGRVTETISSTIVTVYWNAEERHRY